MWLFLRKLANLARNSEFGAVSSQGSRMSVSATFLRTANGPVKGTLEKVLAAMREFDSRFRSGENESGALYSVLENGTIYLPKRIWEPATGIPRSKFYGGQPADEVLRGLRFSIAAGKLLEDLFKSKWSKLDEDRTGLVDSDYPSVYVLAYPHGISRDDIAGPELTGRSKYPRQMSFTLA